MTPKELAEEKSRLRKEWGKKGYKIREKNLELKILAEHNEKSGKTKTGNE